jgi:O-antigen ligase
MAVALAAALIGVCAIAFVSRALPGVWPIDLSEQTTRLGYPVNYWNALGLMAALGIILCAGFTSDIRAGRVVRVVSAGAIPLFVSVLLLTASRTAVITVAIGLIVIVVLGRPRALLLGFAAVVPASVVAGVLTVGADLLVSETPVSAAAQAQGDDLARGVALCVVGAALVRLLLLRFDAAVVGFRLGSSARRIALPLAAVGAVVLIVAPTIAFDIPSRVESRVASFFEVDRGEGSGTSTNSFARLTSSASNGRVDMWRVSLAAFAQAPLRGGGADTFELAWQRERSTALRNASTLQAHSLYLEVLAELGLVGFLLLGGAIATVLAVLARKVRGPDRVLHGTLFAAVLCWAVAAGMDWHWEVPAVSLWFFAIGAAAMARTGSADPPRSTLGLPARVSIALACCAVLAAGPVRVAISQHALEDAIVAFRAGDCERTVEAASASVEALERHEPYQLLGYCASRAGRSGLAFEALRQAIDSDPRHWRPYYALAYTRAAAGEDPRPAIAAARSLNPYEEQITEAAEYFSGDRPEEWERGARRAALPPVPRP